MNEETAKGFWDDAEVIYAYTRAQALEDGVLVDVSEMAKEAGSNSRWRLPSQCTGSALRFLRG
jgi:hypothetical protein